MTNERRTCEATHRNPKSPNSVTAEDQTRADQRIPILLRTPAARRFVSCEPLLGPVDLGIGRWVYLPRLVMSELPFPPVPYAEKGTYRATANPHGALAVPSAGDGGLLGIKPGEFERLPNLDWVIAGGESGPGARPMDPMWARGLRDQCADAAVPFFFKQWGEWGPVPSGHCVEAIEALVEHVWEPEVRSTYRVGKKAAGALLDGREWRQFPGGPA